MGGFLVHLRRALACPLGAILGVALCQGQFGVPDFERDQAEEERRWAEYENALLLETMLAD